MDASSDLWKAENVFYPTAIREATSSSSVAMDDQPEEGVTPSEDLQVSGSSGKALKEGELQDVIVISQHMDPEAPKEVTEPVVGIQVLVRRSQPHLPSRHRQFPLLWSPRVPMLTLFSLPQKGPSSRASKLIPFLPLRT